jgi:CheY-like chemotaxis protein
MNVLIVDDSRSIIKMNTRLTLQVFPDANIVSYNDPVVALEEIKGGDTKFSFALIDYNMNGMDGVQLSEGLIEQTTALEGFNKISIVSANIQQAVQEKAKEKGMSFIDKPMKIEQLQEFLKGQGLLS